MKDYKPKSKIEFKELSQDDINSSLDDMIGKTLKKDKSHNDQHLLERHRNGRMMRQPDMYLGIGESNDFVSNNQQSDSFTYKEAMEDADRDSWQKAIEYEIQSMYTNQVCNLVDPPEGINP